VISQSALKPTISRVNDRWAEAQRFHGDGRNCLGGERGFFAGGELKHFIGG